MTGETKMCDYQGYEFGAGRYPDSVCIDGRLFDADHCDDHGMLYEPAEDIPCPMCRPKEAVRYWTDRNRFGGMKAEDAKIAARSLVRDIQNNRKNGTEPWKAARAT